ncbi:hypothetical protein Ocin01_00210 [Orchesella cincta]|uniref:Uncharacterized protein n=1 Tax=Orchesella cincta TaxID=48709 RepID=A0A1D2NMH1_ORCCI|nr:hypothetical protein Ocin01_00210 [Orchesella cincta]
MSTDDGMYGSSPYIPEEDLFTFADLSSIGFDGSSPFSLNEFENGTEANWVPQGFIPVNANTTQIQGNEIRTAGGIHYVKYIPKDNMTTGFNNSPRVSEHENGSDSPTAKTPSFQLIEVQSNNSSPAAGVTAPSKKTSATAPVKVRKPRGRKPKAVKEAEAAAAAAAAAAEESKKQDNCTPPPRNDGERIDCTPNVTVHHKVPNGNLQGLYTQNVIVKHDNSNYVHEKVSLERLASQDRMEVLSRINDSPMEANRAGTTYFGSSSMQSKHRDYALALGLSKNVPECRPTVGNVQASGVDSRMAYEAQNNFPRYGNADSTSALLNNNGTQQVYHEQQVGNISRLDQFISNRISSIGAPKRSIVAPSLIQRNMSLYTQLTAPKKQFDMENQKLSQEKWKQYPNPSIINQRSHASNGMPSEIGNQLYGAVSIQNLRKNTDTIRDFDKTPNGQNSTVGLGEETASNGNGLSNEEMHQAHYSRYENLRNLPNSNNRRLFAGHGTNNAGVNLNNMLLMQNRIHDLNTKLCGSREENYSLRMKIHLLVKLNRNLSMRVNLAEDQTEILKLKLRETLRPRKYRNIIPSLNMSYMYDEEALLGDDFEPLAGFNDDAARTVLRNGDGARIPDWKYQFDAVTQNQVGDVRQGLRRHIDVDENSVRGFATLKREAGDSLDATSSKKMCTASNKDGENNEKMMKASSFESEIKLVHESKKESCTTDEFDGSSGSSSSSIEDISTSTALVDKKEESIAEPGSNNESGTGDSAGSVCSPKSEKSACDTDVIASDYSENTTSTTFDSPLSAGIRANPSGNEISFKNNGFNNNQLQLLGP